MRLQQASAHPAVFDCDRAPHPPCIRAKLQCLHRWDPRRLPKSKRFHSCAALPFGGRETAKPTTKTVHSSCQPQKWLSPAANIVVFASSSITGWEMKVRIRTRCWNERRCAPWPRSGTIITPSWPFLAFSKQHHMPLTGDDEIDSCMVQYENHCFLQGCATQSRVTTPCCSDDRWPAFSRLGSRKSTAV